jgi:hypothetical protein
MKKILFSLLCAAMFTACNDAPKAPATPTTAETPTAPTVAPTPTTPTVAPTPTAPEPVTATAPTSAPTAATGTSCYEMRFKKDVTAVELTIKGDDVTGFYAWEPYEKDGGHGSLKGKKTGDQITAIFNYMIEGSIQSEEVMFKMEGGKLLKSTNELVDKKKVSVIKDKTKMKWGETFTATDCAKIKAQIDNAKSTADMIAKEKK